MPMIKQLFILHLHLIHLLLLQVQLLYQVQPIRHFGLKQQGKILTQQLVFQFQQQQTF